MHHNPIEPIHIVLDELTNNLGIKRRLEEYSAVTKWEEAVGKQIAAVTAATRISKGVLFVKVKTSTWRNELLMRKREVIDKLNTITGEKVVKDIKFQ